MKSGHNGFSTRNNAVPQRERGKLTELRDVKFLAVSIKLRKAYEVMAPRMTAFQLPEEGTRTKITRTP